MGKEGKSARDDRPQFFFSPPISSPLLSSVFHFFPRTSLSPPPPLPLPQTLLSHPLQPFFPLQRIIFRGLANDDAAARTKKAASGGGDSLSFPIRGTLDKSTSFSSQLFCAKTGEEVRRGCCVSPPRRGCLACRPAIYSCRGEEEGKGGGGGRMVMRGRRDRRRGRREKPPLVLFCALGTVFPFLFSLSPFFPS